MLNTFPWNDSIIGGRIESLMWSSRRANQPSAWHGHISFVHWLVDATRPNLIVELGTERGVSYAAMCHAVAALGLATRCYAVDTWEGDAHTGSYESSVYDDLIAFNHTFYGGFSTLLRCTFDDALPQFAPCSIDLLHIDGLHTYAAVKHDFDTWLPKMSDRGVIILHDTAIRDRGFGVWQLWEELSNRYPYFTFDHSAGLGVLIVGSAPPPPIEALCRVKEAEAVSDLRDTFKAFSEFAYHNGLRDWELRTLRQKNAEAQRGLRRSSDGTTLSPSPIEERPMSSNELIDTGNLPDLDLILSPELDIPFYKRMHPELSLLTDQELAAHYHEVGQPEGRWASPDQIRPNLISKIKKIGSTLEIGPFAYPSLSGPSVSYFDVLDQGRLKARARALGMREDLVPRIEFVSPDGDLSIVDTRFSVVFSSHVIEHQPDLIRHLEQVRNILSTGGYYALVIPDCRYCFDHFISPSNVGEVLQAHEEPRRLHTLASVIEHRALLTHNDPVAHWRGDHGEVGLEPQKVRQAIEEWRALRDEYIDVHAWQFTPSSFREIVQCLREIELVSFAVVRVYETPFNTQEFCAVLRLDASQEGPVANF